VVWTGIEVNSIDVAVCSLQYAVCWWREDRGDRRCGEEEMMKQISR